MQYNYKVRLNKESEGGYTAIVPALPGCITWGEDIDEALAMTKEAIELYIEELQSRGEEIVRESLAGDSRTKVVGNSAAYDETGSLIVSLKNFR